VGRPFNIGSPVETPVIELARRVIESSGSTSGIKLVPYEEAYDEGFEELGKRKPDTTAIESLTGWHASRTIDEAIDDVIAYHRSLDSQPEELRLVG
jgi:UDP-glucose 4-epimerase